MKRGSSASGLGCLLGFLLAVSGCETTSWDGGTPVRPARTIGAAPEISEPVGVGRRPMPAVVRAMWVTRYHYQTPEDIESIIASCAEMGYNTILWQVRGNGTVKYRSQIEPWDESLGYVDPGFDPLAIAVEQAHARGLRIEAWINVMPGWRGSKPPEHPGQLWNAHPDWFLHNARGERQPLGNFYVILNPCLPEVRRHLADVVDEIVTNYEVDGIHLDYVRYAWDTTPNAKQDYPRDPRTLELFFRDTGRTPEQDPVAWDNWRINQLSDLVAGLHDVVRRRAPGATLTAATWASPRSGLRDYFQNATGWLRAGLIDAAYPMAYTDEAAKLEEYIGIYQMEAPGTRVIPGLGAYKHERPEPLSAQIRLCQAWGGDFAIFSYESVRAVSGDRNASRDRLQKSNELRRMRRDAIAQVLMSARP